MATLPQRQLFCWNEIDELGDLHRLRLVLDFLPDERLMTALERRRGRGRDDYPIRAMWNSLLAGIVFQHPSIEQLRRELSRNAQLRWLCGFNPHRAVDLLPGNVELMCTSERFLPTNVGGVSSEVQDYSISQVGPADNARSLWRSVLTTLFER